MYKRQHVELENADIVVNDILNTSLEYMRELTRCGVRVVNLEDLGEGAVYADAVINDLYSCQNQRNNFYWGSDYYCLREEFLNIRKKKNVERSVQEVLVSFGGTDPSHLTEKIISIFNSFPKDYFFHVTVIIGAGNSDKEKVKKLIAENANKMCIRDRCWIQKSLIILMGTILYLRRSLCSDWQEMDSLMRINTMAFGSAWILNVKKNEMCIRDRKLIINGWELMQRLL